MNNVTIFAGGFGSGKSELAMNCAFEKSLASKKCILADLDLVNPYFASRDLRGRLEKAGVRVVAPSDELAFADVPSIPSEMVGILREDNDLIVDLAGDEVGSLVIGYLSSLVKARASYEFNLVINPYRPFTENIDKIVELQEQIERAAHLNFTGIISNPNLAKETTIDIICNGHKRVEAFAEEIDLPIRYLAVSDGFYHELLPYYPGLMKEIKLYLRPDWL